ncbi:hypothetical protein ACA910_014817 [Epithemia clementina (nom. ined.)]
MGRMGRAWVFVVAAVLFVTTTTSSTNTAPLTVPTFALNDLLTGHRSDELAMVLTTTGLLAVTTSTSTTNTKKEDWRNAALGGLCHCRTALQEKAAAPSSGTTTLTATAFLEQGPLLDDPTTWRTTVATATAGTTPLPLVVVDGDDNSEDANPHDDDDDNRNLLRNACGKDTFQAMEELRDQVAQVNQAFVLALDRFLTGVVGSQAPPPPASQQQQPPFLLRHAYHGGYPTVASIQAAANHLEHFHIYSKQEQEQGADHILLQQQQEDSSTATTTLSWHTDAGLFLSFVPARDCHNDDGTTVDDSFWVKAPGRGESSSPPQPVAFPTEPAVMIMLGAGAQHWLQTSPIALQATRHAVHMQPGQVRAWYGMMTLVPEIAIVQQYPEERTFGDMKRHMSLASQSRRRSQQQEQQANNKNNDYHYYSTISIGCGSEGHGLEDEEEEEDDDLFLRPKGLLSSSQQRHSRRRLQHVQNADACNNSTNFFCWMSCLDIPNAKNIHGYLTEGYSLYCMDPAIYAGSGNQVSPAVEPCANGKVHNANCMGVWAITAPNVPGYDLPDPQQQAGNDTTSSYNNEVQFCYGGTSMYMDGFHWTDTTCVIYLFPDWVLTSQGKLAAAGIGTIVFASALELIIHLRRRTMLSLLPCPGYRRLTVSALFYGLQITMGYMLMLVIMTYSGVLFFCTIVGLVSGHVLFNSKDAFFGKALEQGHGTDQIKQGDNNNDGLAATMATNASNNGTSQELEDTVGTTNPNDVNLEQCLGDEEQEMIATSNNNDKAAVHCRNRTGTMMATDLQIPEGATPCCQNAL